MYPGIELRLLRYAVAVAEELNFSRAARCLHVSQPSLSKQILQLEDSLGFKLFRRTKQFVELTPAGHRFVVEARKALHYSNRAIEVAKEADREEHEVLMVGYCAYIDLYFLSVLRSMKAVTTMRPIYRSSSTTEIVAKLLSHEWHAGLLTLPISERELVVRPLFREPVAVALPVSHPLAKQAQVELRDLANETLILPTKRANPQFHDALTRSFRDIGLRLGTAQEVVNLHEALHLASERLGIAVVQASASHAHIEGVTVRVIADPNLAIETGIASNRENTPDSLKLFLAAVDETRNAYLQRQERKPPKSA
jgi:DNA-binding transcriptional LysR family regulator